jgi:hypothetical protein
MLPLLVPVGFSSSQQLSCGITSSAHGRGGQAEVRDGRKGRMGVAEKAGCEEKDGRCFCGTLEPGTGSGFVLVKGTVPPQDPEGTTIMVPQVPKLGTASNLETRSPSRASRRVSRATLTADSPSTHPAREVRSLRRHGVGEREVTSERILVLLCRQSLIRTLRKGCHGVENTFL